MNHILRLPTLLAEFVSRSFISSSLDQIIRLSGFAKIARQGQRMQTITIKVKS